MLGNLNGWHLLIVLAIILLLFGAARLPALSKSVGQSIRLFRKEVGPDVAAAREPDAASGPPSGAGA